MVSKIKFSEHLISQQFEYAFGISVADISGNGYLDIVATDTNVGLYWFENMANGNFTRHVIHRRRGEWLERHAIADINGDGKPEIISVDNINGCILYFEFSGDPRLEKSWKYNYITEGGLPGAYDLAIGDFCGNGNLDVAASGWRIGNQFALFEHSGDNWYKHLLDEDTSENRAVCAADVNGNGRLDVVGTISGGSEVVWYENPEEASEAEWPKHVIDRAPRPIHGHPVDMNGNGKVDIVMALGQNSSSIKPENSDPSEYQQIVWYENPGQLHNSQWEKHIICPYFPQAFEAVAGDIDGDGEIEVVATAWGEQGMLAFFKHRGDPQGPWDMYKIKENWTNANNVILADLDKDGKLEIVASAERGSNEVRWWKIHF